ncbi:helix-turn-helix transcriptional regulator [Actinocorallia lasiicapitis]
MARRPLPLNPKSSPLAAFGAELRHLREHHAPRPLTLDELAKISGYSAPYLSTVERAKETPTREFAVNLDQSLSAGGVLVRMWDNTLDPGPFPPWFDWPHYEVKAVTLRSYQNSVVDGQLQTEAYASAILKGDKEAVAGRMKRQEIQRSDDPPRIICTMDHSVLLREIGGPEVMFDQLQHLADLMRQDRFHLCFTQFVKHEGSVGSFVIATLEDRSEVSYVETALRGVTTAQPDDLRILSDRFEDIRSKTLSEDQSLELVLSAAEQRWT